ncbi:MAG TPA: hypothetical protein VGI45_31900 [Terracidiphilus sp.]|jgi:hypothetical protein
MVGTPFMDVQPQTAFYRRVNPDGSIDLICPKCWCTAATVKLASEIAEAEKSHVCYAERIAS